MTDSSEQDLGSILTRKREAETTQTRDLALDLERKRADQERARSEAEQTRIEGVREQIRQLTEQRQALERKSAELDLENDKIGPLHSETTSKEAVLSGVYNTHSDILKGEGYKTLKDLKKVGSAYRDTGQVREARQARVQERLQARSARRTRRHIVAEHTKRSDLETKGRAPDQEQAKQALQDQIDQLETQIQELYWQTPEGHTERVEAVRTELRDVAEQRGQYHSVRTSVDKISTVEPGDLDLADTIHGDGPEVVKEALRDGFKARLDHETQAERERRNLPKIKQDLEHLRAFPREVAQAQRLIGEVCGLRQQATHKVAEAGCKNWYLNSLELNAGIDDSFNLYRDPEEYFTRQCQRMVDNWTAMFGSAHSESSQTEQVGRHMSGLDSGRHVRVIDDPRILLHRLERFKQLYSRIIEMPAETLTTGSHPEVTIPPTGSVDSRPQVITSKWSLENETRQLLGRYPADRGYALKAVEQATSWATEQEEEIASENERAIGLLGAKIDWDWSDQELSRYQRKHPGARDLEQKDARIVQEREVAAQGLLTLAGLRSTAQELANDRVTVGESYHRLFIHDEELFKQRDANSEELTQLKGELGLYSNIPEHAIGNLEKVDSELGKARETLTRLQSLKRPRWGAGKEHDRFLHNAQESVRVLEAIKARHERWEAIRRKMELVSEVIPSIEGADLSREFVGKTLPFNELLDILQARLEAKSTAELSTEEREVLDENNRLQSVQRAKRGDFMARFEAPRPSTRR